MISYNTGQISKLLFHSVRGVLSLCFLVGDFSLHRLLGLLDLRSELLLLCKLEQECVNLRNE